MRADVPLGRGVQDYLGQQFRVHADQKDCIRVDRDPECLHRFRVALRRSRAVLGELGAHLHPELAELRRAMADVARATNAKRDADVFLEHLAEYRTWLPAPLRPGLEGLLRHIATRRARAYRQVTDLLSGDAYRDLETCWQHWLAVEPDGLEVHRGQDLAAVIDARVARRIRKIRKRADTLVQTSPPEAIHRLRIACKKLRYLLEFSLAETGDRKAGQAITRLGKVQTLLGAYNDAAVQLGWLWEYLATQSRVPRLTAAAVGYLGAVLQRRQKKLRRRLLRKVAPALRSGSFWSHWVEDAGLLEV